MLIGCWHVPKFLVHEQKFIFCHLILHSQCRYKYRFTYLPSQLRQIAALSWRDKHSFLRVDMYDSFPKGLLGPFFQRRMSSDVPLPTPPSDKLLSKDSKTPISALSVEYHVYHTISVKGLASGLDG
jgi:hypothetical protein